MSSRIGGTTDAALVLRCSTERVRQLEREGKLPAQKTLGGRRVFDMDDVERLATEREGQKKECAASAA